jgi:hypothetical protein
MALDDKTQWAIVEDCREIAAWPRLLDKNVCIRLT